MNYLAVLLGAYLAFQANNFGTIPADKSEWLSYKQQYGKDYKDEPRVDRLKQVIYEFNKQRVQEFNRHQPEAPQFELELNHLADMSEIDMMQINGFRPTKSANLLGDNSEMEQKFLDAILNSSAPVPDAVDWRTVQGRVSEVKNQGSCGSCWAFSAVGALEGQERQRPSYMGSRNSSELIQLSEQNLVDCVKDDQGCNGGIMADALRYVKTEGGIEDEASYPYEGRTKACRFQKSKVAFRDTGAAVLSEGDEEQLKKVVARYGPVSVAIDASSFWFQLYRKGVYVNKHCKSGIDQLDHGVLVVGYGTDPKKGDYWIVKNSWGTNWGQNGYVLMARNRKNMCGIATLPTIATF